MKSSSLLASRKKLMKSGGLDVHPLWTSKTAVVVTLHSYCYQDVLSMAMENGLVNIYIYVIINFIQNKLCFFLYLLFHSYNTIPVSQ